MLSQFRPPYPFNQNVHIVPRYGTATPPVPEPEFVEDLTQIPTDVFTNVIAEYLPTTTFEKLGKTNREIRDAYLRNAANREDAWGIALDTRNVDLLNLIKDRPLTNPLDYFWQSLSVGPEFVYVAIKKFDEEDFENVLDWLSESYGEHPVNFSKWIVEDPRILDMFLPYIDRLGGIVNVNQEEISMDIFNLIRNKVGYIPKKLFDEYIGTMVFSCYDEISAENTGSCLLNLVSDPNSTLNRALALQQYVR